MTNIAADLDEQTLLNGSTCAPERTRASPRTPSRPRRVPTRGDGQGRTAETQPETGSYRQVLALLGLRPWLVAALVVVSLPAALCESAVLVVVAATAGALVTGTHRVSMTVGPLHLSSSIGHLLLLGAIIAFARIALAVPVSYLPARILADAQARLRDRLFSAFIRASWTVKSGEQEGQLQEVVTSQVLQATNIVSYVLNLVVTTATLVVLIASALLIGLVPALVVMGSGVALFALLRPLGGFGSRRARTLSAMQVDYANAVGEATRLAEEAQVFGAGRAQEIQHGHLVESVRRRFQVTQFLLGLVPATYYGMVLLLLIGGLSLIAATGAGRLVSLGAAILLLVRAANYGQQLQGYYQGIRQSGPFLERLRQTEERYRSAAISRGQRPGYAGSLGHLRPRQLFVHTRTASATRSELSRRGGRGYRDSRADRGGQINPRPNTARTAGPDFRALPGRRRTRPDHLGARDWPEPSHTCRKNPGCYTPQWRRTSPSSETWTVRSSSERPAWLTSTKTSGAGHMVTTRSSVSGPTPFRGVSVSASAWPAPWSVNLFVLVLDEPTSSLDAHSESLIQESLAALKGQLTLFVVAHRLSTLACCDRVLVIVDGEIEAFAPMRELREESAFYRRVSELHSLSVGNSAGDLTRTQVVE